MYPTGYFPISTVMFDSLKLYRNSVGAYFHLSANVGLSNSFLSDNGINIDIEKTLSPPIRLTNVTIIGESNTFRNVVRNKKLGKVCNAQVKLSTFNIGIETRTWKGQIGGTGSIWQNVQFRNFNHTTCKYVSPISMDYSVSFKFSRTIYYVLTLKSYELAVILFLKSGVLAPVERIILIL
jgi:hypothetical protein